MPHPHIFVSLWTLHNTALLFSCHANAIYKDIGMGYEILVSLVVIICRSYIHLHFVKMIFIAKH